MVIQEEVEVKEDAPAREFMVPPRDLEASARDLEAEFDKLFQPYADDEGIKKEDIDYDLREAQGSFSKLRKKGRHEKPEGQRLQKKTDFERLVEVSDLISAKSISNGQSSIQELRSEIDKVLRPAWGKSRDDIHDELVKARERMTALHNNGLDGISTEADELQRRITDLDRLVELSGVLSAERNPLSRTWKICVTTLCNLTPRSRVLVTRARNTMTMLVVMDLLTPMSMLTQINHDVIFCDQRQELQSHYMSTQLTCPNTIPLEYRQRPLFTLTIYVTTLISIFV